MTAPAPRVAVIIVTYNSADQIRQCLASVAQAAASVDIEVIVVDNNSGDDSLAGARAAFPDVAVCANANNRGFAAACNQGIERTRGELVLLLNPDACLQPQTLATLIEHLDQNPDVGIVGPALEEAPGVLQRDISATGLFPSFVQALHEYTRMGVWFPASPWVRDYLLVGHDRRATRSVAMVQGACFLVRRRVLETVGPLDERFFLYFEETDLCHRAAQADWQTHYVGTAAATHLGSCSSPDRQPVADEFIRSMYRYHRKHYGWVEASLLWAILAPYHLLKTARMSFLTWQRPDDARLRADRRTVAARTLAHLRLLVDWR